MYECISYSLHLNLSEDVNNYSLFIVPLNGQHFSLEFLQNVYH
jgi:hypothetical protein